jgi:hypothetical protein
MKRATCAALALTAILFGVLSAASPAPASASPPAHDFEFAFDETGVIDCGTFQDNFVDFLSGTGTTFYDNNGDPIRSVFHIEHHSNDINSVTGVTIHEHGHYIETDDVITGTRTVTGNSEVANRPGFGVVVQDVGRAVFDSDGNLVFFAGGRKHSELFGGDQVLCDALA